MAQRPGGRAADAAGAAGGHQRGRGLQPRLRDRAVLQYHRSLQRSGGIYLRQDQAHVVFSALARAWAICRSIFRPLPVGRLPGTPKNSAGDRLGVWTSRIGRRRDAFRRQCALSERGHCPHCRRPSRWCRDIPWWTARASYTLSHWMGTIYVDNLTNQIGISSFSDPANYGPNYQAIVSRRAPSASRSPIRSRVGSEPGSGCRERCRRPTAAGWARHMRRDARP
jgi:hypothetical protein